jgi:hypothetical protein
VAFLSATVGKKRAILLAGCAARLLADAERIANSITGESSKAWALTGVAEALAVTDPDRAERIANSITEEPSKAMAPSGVAKALAAVSS